MRELWPMLRPLTICITLCVITAPACAADLMDVYHDALDHDTQFKAAYSNYLASAEALPQALAALLPQVNIATQATRIRQDVEVFPLPFDDTYSSTSWQVNASQTLFNYQAWQTVAQAAASVKAAQATFNDAAQNLILRVSHAYLDVLRTQDTLNFAEAKKRANKRQLDQATERFKVGLEAITSVYEAKAAYDQATAEVISARNRQINQNENLRRITNHVYEQVAPLRNNKIPLIRPEPNQADEWVNTGLKQNFNLLATKYRLEAARDFIKAQAAGNWPVISVLGNTQHVVNNGMQSVSFFVPNNFTNSNVALAMTFPVYQGGLVASKTRQAIYKFQVSSEQLEQAYRDVVVNSRISFNTITDGLSKVAADRQTVLSRTNQVNSTSAQFDAGTRTMVDVTNAQQRLFEAQERQAADQYQLIKDQLRLKYLAGTLSVTDIQEINAWLQTVRINQFAPTPGQSQP